VLTDIILSVVEPDMDIVAVLRDPGGVQRQLKRSTADVVILGSDSIDSPATSAPFFEAHPQIKVLRVVDGGRMVYLHELRASLTALGQISLSDLLEVIRQSVQGSTE
jgi:hypothetical protein